MATAAQRANFDVAAMLTDSGLETDLIFHGGFTLPSFAAFVLLDDDDGVGALDRYYREHAEIAARAGAPFVFETPTWRASPDWGARVGYDVDRLADVNRRAVAMMRSIASDVRPALTAFLVSGCIGPRGDGYAPTETMTAQEAQDYHEWQVGVFARAGADLVTAMTITYTAEAIGIVRAGSAVGVPAVVSFTLETDGRLPDGTTLADAIVATDAATGGAALHFMVNCAHPTHFDSVLDPVAPWMSRLRGVRANASRRSHAELDEAEELDDGDPEQLAREYAALRSRIPGLTVLGGCCGTDVRHARAIASVCVPVV